MYRWFYKHRIKRLHRPVFIVGCGHSGTSIILRVIGAHSGFHAIEDESNIFYKSNKERLVTILDWVKILIKKNKRRIVEKTPAHIYCIEEIFKIFDDAKIICMLRDGRDVACSHKQRISFEHGLDIWVKSTLSIKPYINHDSVKVVKLEEFVSNPIKSLEGIMDFLGENLELPMLDYHKSPTYYYDSNIIKPLSAEDGKNHRALRNWQINQPLFKTTLRWKLEMTGDEEELFKRKAQEELEFWGYENNDLW
jgi:hypothetical protein